MARGAFVTLEGLEGVGKSSCLEAASAAIRDAGHAVVTTREPGGTSLGEAVREWILHGAHDERPSAETEALLMFAARRHHVEHVIEPALRAGRWVVCDRFTDATFAYQGGGRGADAGLLKQLAATVPGALTPDLTLLLDAPVEVGLARIGHREPDHFEREQRDFFERVRAAYLQRLEAEPRRIRRVDATADLETVRSAVAALVSDFVARFDGCAA